jgi:hypothetical protein
MALQKLTEAFTLFFQSIFTIVKVIILSKYYVRLPKVEQEQECVILGNGPCLTKDLDSCRDFILKRKKLCVNLFAFSKEYEPVKPEYYVLAAPEFWMKNPIELHEIQRTKLAQSICEKTEWNMTLLIPFEAKHSKFESTIKANTKIKVIYFNSTPVEGLYFFSKFLFKMNLGMPRPHNVLIPTIFLSMNLGFKNIFIFGADHSWHEEIKVDQSNNVTLNHQHFFDSNETRFAMYKLGGQEYHIHDIFRKLHFAFKGYFVLENYAGYLGAKIKNASSKSYIDAFEKIDLSKSSKPFE